MDLEPVRRLMHKINHGDPKSGVGEAKTVTAWETRLTATENPDGELLDVTVERVDHGTHALGHVGSARPCCDAPGDEHTPECAMRRLDDDNENSGRE